MTVASTIAKIRARRITASSITQSELIELVEAVEAAADEKKRVRAAGYGWVYGLDLVTKREDGR